VLGSFAEWASVWSSLTAEHCSELEHVGHSLNLVASPVLAVASISQLQPRSFLVSTRYKRAVGGSESEVNFRVRALLMFVRNPSEKEDTPKLSISEMIRNSQRTSNFLDLKLVEMASGVFNSRNNKSAFRHRNANRLFSGLEILAIF
jgi:hypothetical protein